MILSHQALKNIARLKQKKYRIADGKFLVEGARFVYEALQSDWCVDKVVLTHDFESNPFFQKIFTRSRKRSTQQFFVSPAEFKKIADTSNAQGIVAVIKNKQDDDSFLNKLQTKPKYFIVAIESLTDPGNLGTIIRTAAWFDVDAVILGPECVAWHNPKTLRATMGAIFHLPVIEVSNFYKFLADAKKRPATIYFADLSGEACYTDVKYARQKILLVGNETAGVSAACKRLADQSVVIPRRGKGESLNAAVAAAILMAEISQISLTQKVANQ